MTDTELAALMERAPGPDLDARRRVAERAARVLRPAGALARLDKVAAWLAGWQRTDRPSVERPAAAVFVADHGVAAEGVSAYPASVTARMLEALRAGAATANIMARRVGATLQAVDVGVGRPTANMVVEPAMGQEAFATAFEIGRATVRGVPADLWVFGEMGIGNTTSAAAVAALLYGGPVEQWVGRGTGVDAVGLARKVAAVEAARRRVGYGAPPMEILRQVGGAELAAVAGAVVEARLRSLPVVLDGFVVTAAVAVLESVAPGSLDHCVAGHLSPEPGHERLLERLGLEPLLDLGLRLGEGTGALAAVPLIRMAAAAVVEVATFEEWGLE